MAPTFLKPIFQYLPRIGINLLLILRTMYPLALKLSEYYLWCQENLPVELITAGWGLILCFFGGTFQLSLAAYEAFKVRSRKTFIQLIHNVNELTHARFARRSFARSRRSTAGTGPAEPSSISTKPGKSSSLPTPPMTKKVRQCESTSLSSLLVSNTARRSSQTTTTTESPTSIRSPRPNSSPAR